jgi:hypothetical protein
MASGGTNAGVRDRAHAATQLSTAIDNRDHHALSHLLGAERSEIAALERRLASAEKEGRSAIGDLSLREARLELHLRRVLVAHAELTANQRTLDGGWSFPQRPGGTTPHASWVALGTSLEDHTPSGIARAGQELRAFGREVRGQNQRAAEYEHWLDEAERALTDWGRGQPYHLIWARLPQDLQGRNSLVTFARLIGEARLQLDAFRELEVEPDALTYKMLSGKLSEQRARPRQQVGRRSGRAAGPERPNRRPHLLSSGKHEHWERTTRRATATRGTRPSRASLAR